MSDYEDFELENLRQAALKSMQSKATGNSVISNNVSGSHSNKANASKPNQNCTKKNFKSQQPQQFHQPSGPPFHPQFDGNQPPPQFNGSQQFNQYNSHHQPPFDQASSFGGTPQQPPFGHNAPFSNNVPLQHFNHQFNNPQFRNHPSHHQQPFNGPPSYNHPPPSQFNQPPFTQAPKSNLIVISAGKSSNNEMMLMHDHPMNHPNCGYPGNPMNPAMMPHQPKHSRNGFGRQANKKFGNHNSNRRRMGKGGGQSSNPSDGARPKDVPTDSSKNTDNLPSRFRRIDRDSSSDEDDEESDNDDNIERFRQTYDTNEANNQDNPDKEDRRLSSASKAS